MSFPRPLRLSDLILLTIQYRWSPIVHRLSENKKHCTKVKDYCFLCRYFREFLVENANFQYYRDCEDCPIFLYTNEDQCLGTPFHAFQRSFIYNDQLTYAREMLSLLWSIYSYYILRPELNEELVDVEEFIKQIKRDRKEEGLPPVKLFED